MKLFFEELQSRNELLYWFGWFSVVGTICCFILMQTTTIHVLGVNSWLKPFKFFLSTVIFTWSMGWYLGYLGASKSISTYSWVVVTVLAFELVYISLKASQGQLSHFNISSAFNGAMFSLMGLAISILTMYTAYIGYLFFVNDFPNLPTTYVWGIRMGILLFVVFAFEGGVMGAKLAHTVGSADGGEGLPVTNWSTRHGDLRIAHFVGMHALQLLPLLAYYAVRNVRGIIIIGLLYFVLTSFLFIQALLGKPFVSYKQRSETNHVNRR
jgi:hypothetical protein